MMSVRVRDVSIPVSKVDLRPDPAGITRVSNLDPTTVTCAVPDQEIRHSAS
jgi:hypothetical protein